MSVYSQYILGSSPTVVELELIEISHFRLSQTYRFVRNSVESISVTHEGPAGPFTYTYMPMEIRRLSSQNDLDQSLKVTFGDLGLVFPQELDLIRQSNGMHIKPVLKHRTYKSTDLASPLFGPSVLEITAINFDKQGASLEATPPRLNYTRTGLIYDIKTFPMMKAYFNKK